MISLSQLGLNTSYCRKLAFGLVGRAQRCLHGLYDIPIQCSDSDHYAENTDSQWEEVYSACSGNWPLPMQRGGSPVFFQSLPAHFPPQGVMLINDGRIVGRHGVLFSSDKIHLHWHSWHRGTIEAPTVSKEEWKNAGKQVLRGTVVTFVSEYCDRNYCHFLFDALPRMHLFENSSFASSTVDHFVLPGRPNKQRLQIASQLGVPIDRIVWYGDTKGLTCETLICPTFPGIARCYPKWSIEYIRTHLASPIIGTNRRIYISREGYARDVENLSELKCVLDAFDFQIIDPGKYRDVNSAFAGANIVVGPHGAGMADVAFCSPGTHVMELVPDSNCHPYYYSIAVGAGCIYSAMLGRTLNVRGASGKSRSVDNFVIDKREFEIAIKSLILNDKH